MLIALRILLDMHIQTHIDDEQMSLKVFVDGNNFFMIGDSEYYEVLFFNKAIKSWIGMHVCILLHFNRYSIHIQQAIQLLLFTWKHLAQEAV